MRQIVLFGFYGWTLKYRSPPEYSEEMRAIYTYDLVFQVGVRTVHLGLAAM